MRGQAGPLAGPLDHTARDGATSMAGLWYGIAANSIWGLFPLYWRMVRHVPALEVLGHRIVWSFVVLVAVVAGSWHQRRRALQPLARPVLALYAVAAVLIGANWFLYVYAVNAGFVLQTSLGYFITPLVNVLMGVGVLRERLRAGQWAAVTLASAGVLWLAWTYGHLPWIALGLALSFGSYGLVKKQAPMPSLEGLTVETAVLVVPATVYLALLHRQGTGAFLVAGSSSDALLIGGGVVTVIPLLLFASAVRRVPLSVIGILQYISPSIQFLLGVFVFREPFTRAQLVGFVFVWLGLVLFGVDGARNRGK